MTQNLTSKRGIPRFLGETKRRHYAGLRQRVRKVLDEKDSPSQFLLQSKAIIFPLVYVAVYLLALNTYPNLYIYFGSFVFLGLFMVVIYLTVIHEVAHDNIFGSKKLNRMVLYFFDILGANSFIWKRRHTLMHHNYPNINGWDTDIEQSALFKVSPDAPTSSVHKYQHYLIFLLYPLYLFNWLLIRDFKDFFQKRRTVRKIVKIPTVEYVKLFVFKIFYLFYMFVVPVLFFEISFIHVLLGFVVLTFTASVLALLVLLPPHASIENEFPVPSEEMQINSTYLEHQLRTTNDIKANGWFVSFFMGNFNLHLAHHLFPHLNYMQLKDATRVLETYTKEQQLPYRAYPMKKALVNHYKLIRHNAEAANFFEETL